MAGGNGGSLAINQISFPGGLYVDDDQTVYVAEQSNQRIMEWKSGATSGEVVAGGKGKGSGAHQLSSPRDVIIDKERDIGLARKFCRFFLNFHRTFENVLEVSI